MLGWRRESGRDVMKDFEGKVAVVTGAASGIGLGMAERFAREGMKVVLADIEEDALNGAVADLRRKEHDVIGVHTDVSRAEAVEELKQKTLEAYGKVHLVCNNAGVLNAAGPIWQNTLNDWQWMLGVNFWGVVHGIRSFLPVMLDQSEEGWLVNTASIAGLGTSGSIYGITKHAVVALSETLYLQLKARGAKVGVSCLCPVFVNTKIVEAERNRPRQLWNREAPEETRGWEALAERLRAGISSEEMAEIVVEGIREERFYVIPEAYDGMPVKMRLENILGRRNP
jgi:NAD(P)-dependent dehydrogenase (short-subunit alcohol dehydrogenase family)